MQEFMPVHHVIVPGVIEGATCTLSVFGGSLELECLLKAALENGVNTSDALIPPVYSADVQVIGIPASI